MPTVKHKSKPVFARFALLALAAAAALGLATGTAAAEEPPVEPQPPQLAFEPGSHDFGLQQVNSNPAQTTFQLRNVGAEAVHVDSLGIPGPGSEVFWTGSGNCWGAMLQPNETCFVQVYFGSHDANEYVGQLQAVVGTSSFSANLTGSGGRAIFAPASSPVDFGAAAVGSAGTTRAIAVTNVGNFPGGVFIAVVSGGAMGSFHLLDENCTGHLLTPWGTCILQVRFQPLGEGIKTATLSLFGEGDGGTEILLSGVGTAPEPPASSAGATGPLAASAAPTLSAHQPRHPRPKVRIKLRHRRAALGVSRLVTRVK